MEDDKSLRELDAWIAEHVMGWHPVQSVHDLSSKKDFCVSGAERGVWIIERGNNIKHFHPTTDPAAAMLVLETCLKKSAHIEIDFDLEESGLFYIMHAKSKSLPLAICLFARQLFTK